jgi:hypothetical protein
LRKGIKIKAVAIFLAWMMIFIHNIIPHNHLHEDSMGCRELVHNVNPTEDDCSGPLKFQSQPGDISVCHISNFLYHQFSEDSLIHYNAGAADRYIVYITGTVTFITEESSVQDIYYGSSSLRSPPVA